MASGQFDIWLMPEFSGAATDTPIMEDLELTCEITKVERVLPLLLKGAARETYRPLSKEQRDDVKEIKPVLIKDYGMDSLWLSNNFPHAASVQKRLQMIS